MTDETAKFAEIEKIQSEIRELEKKLEKYKHQTDGKISSIYEEMEVVGKRTDKIETLTEELAQIIKGYNDQLESFHRNLEYLNRSIDELKDSKKLMERTRDELNERFDSFSNELKLLVASYNILKNLPEKINELALAQSHIKNITDSIKKFTWVVISGVIILVINEVFGDVITRIAVGVGG